MQHLKSAVAKKLKVVKKVVKIKLKSKKSLISSDKKLMARGKSQLTFKGPMNNTEISKE